MNSYRFSLRAVAARFSRSRFSTIPAPSQPSSAWWIGIARNALLRAPARTRVPVDVDVVRGKCDVALFEERNRVGEEAGDLARPRAHRRTALPAPDVQHDHVAGANAHARSLLPRFEIGARDRRARLDPVDALQLRHVVEHAARDDAVAAAHDVALLAAGLGRDVLLHRVAVVHLPVHEEVAERVGVAEREAVIADLIGVGRRVRPDAVRRAFEDLIRPDVGRLRLRHRAGHRHDDAAAHETRGLCTFSGVIRLAVPF